MRKQLLAYEIRENHEGQCVIVFEASNAAARRIGGCELNLEFDEVDSCRRAQQFDQYAPGPVPPKALIDAGWWFECHHCGRRVSDEMADDDDDSGDACPGELEATYRGEAVYCSQHCAAMDFRSKRDRVEAVDALIEVVEGDYPGSVVTAAHIYKDRLVRSDPNQGIKTSAHFRFPGGRYPVEMRWGEPHVYVHPEDVDQFCDLYSNNQNTQT